MAADPGSAEAALDCYDPKRLIRQVMELDEPAATSARECIVLWLMSLPDTVDPAKAARCLVDGLSGRAPGRTLLAAELVRELEDVARFPREQLLAARPARRGRSRRV